MNVSDIPFRSLNNPNLNLKETNAILRFIKNIAESRRVVTSQYGTSFKDTSKRLYINVKFHTELQPYSIFSIEEFGTVGSSFRIDIPHPAGATANNLRDLTAREGQIFLTNDGQSIYPNVSYDCPIIGYHRPYKIMYAGTRPIANDKLHPALYNYAPNQYKVQLSSTGALLAVTDGDDETGTVWVIRAEDKGYLPWVRTCTHPDNPVYPNDPSNVFVVERGKLLFDDTLINDNAPSFNSGNQTPVFIGTIPRDFYIAYSPCGYVPEGTVRRMSNDCGRWYLIDDCRSVSGSSAGSVSSEQPSESSDSSVSSG